uniref:Putative tick transposon n=1 Tax=Rhipicephalus microplus TaxID=6941 RepID=A0A6M2CSQ5_RHIMP
MSCGKMYIGQTGRCINTRLTEHKRALANNAYSHLRRHCLECGCSPLFSETKILASHRDKMTREVIEAFHIAKRKDYCISQASITLSDCEVGFLENTLSL